MDKKEGLRVLCRKIPRNRLISLGILVLLMVAATVMNHRGQFAGYSGPELRQGYSGSGSDLCLNDGRH